VLAGIARTNWGYGRNHGLLELMDTCLNLLELANHGNRIIYALPSLALTLLYTKLIALLC